MPLIAGLESSSNSVSIEPKGRCGQALTSRSALLLRRDHLAEILEPGLGSRKLGPVEEPLDDSTGVLPQILHVDVDDLRTAETTTSSGGSSDPGGAVLQPEGPGGRKLGRASEGCAGVDRQIAQ